MKPGLGKPHGTAQGDHLCVCQGTVGARRQPAQPQRPKPDALEVQHRMAHRLAHAAHLPLAPFGQFDFKHRGFLVLPDDAHPGGGGRPVL